MNKEEEKHLDHDLVEYDGDHDTFIQGLDNRYEQGNTRVMEPRMYHHLDEVPAIYRMNEDREWVFYKQPSSWIGYTYAIISQRTVINSNRIMDFPDEISDYIFPEIKTALLSRGRTAKLRVKRVKPAYMGKQEEVE
jgi:hypothetical protein